MNTNPFAWSPGPLTDNRSAAALARRAENEIAVFGYMCLDTAALLLEHGIDAQGLEIIMQDRQLVSLEDGSAS